MAEEEVQEEQIEEQPKKKKPIGLIIIIVVLFLVIIGMGVAMFMFMNSDNLEENNQQKVEKVEKKTSISDENSLEKQTEELIVNIQGTGRTYLKIQMTLVFDNETFDEEIYNKKVPYITDTIIGVLSSKVKEEIATYGGKIDLKDELKSKLNMMLPKELEISKILFTTFVMQ